MRDLLRAPAAERDIAAVLWWSSERFGPAAGDRYRLLIAAAFDLLRADPDRPGVRPGVGLSAGVRLYALRHARLRVPPAGRVGRPRQLIAFRADETSVTVLRVLHESMNLPKQLGSL